MYAEIVVYTLPNTPRYKIYEGDFLVFGRGQNADVILEDNAISRVHCKIFFHKKEFWIQDFGSRNSTVINNEKVSRQSLKNNDNIRIGHHKIKFYLHSKGNNKSKEEEEGFSQLRRHDKLLGKIAVDLKLISSSELRKCITLQETLSEDGEYIHLEDILLQENILTQEQIQKINKEKIKVPVKIEGYKLQELIGIGGMGRIYKGRSLATNEIVAVKILADIHQEEKMQLSQQFIREAKAVAKLNHSNIVSGLDFGFSGKNMYIVMEYIDGPNLQQYLKEKGGRLLPDEAINFTIQITKALEHAHSCNLIHRDIKPENVLLSTSYTTKLCDFGLVKDTDDKHLEDEQIFGTIAYMSPEQCLFKKDIDIRSDIYSLGVVLYRMMYGQLPFNGNKKEIRKQHVQKEVRFPEIQQGANSKVAQVIKKMMAKKIHDRYQTPSEVLQDLNTLLDQFSPVNDIAGTSEVNTQLKIGSLDDTETRMHKKWSETQEIRKWEVQNLPGNNSFQLLLHLTQRVPALSPKKYLVFWRNLSEHSKIFLFVMMIALLTLPYLFFKKFETQQDSYYKIISSEIENQNYSKANALIFKHLQSLKQEEDVLAKLQQSLYIHAYKKWEQQQFPETIVLCEQIISWKQVSFVAQEAKALKQKAEFQILLQRQKNSFEEKQKNIESMLGGDTEESELYSLIQELRSIAKTPEQLERYQEINKKHQYILYQKTLSQKNKYYPAQGLNIPIVQSLIPIADDSRIAISYPGLQKQSSTNNELIFSWNSPYIYALSPESGVIAWYKKIPGFSATAHMIVVKKRNASFLLFWEEDKVHLYNAATGSFVWSLSFSVKIVSGITTHAEKAYVPCDDQHVYEINIDNGNVLGAFFIESVCTNAPLLDSDHQRLFLYGKGNYCYIFDLQKKYLQSLTEIPGQIVYSSLPSPNDHLVITKQENKYMLSVFDLAKQNSNLDNEVKLFLTLDGQLQMCNYLGDSTEVLQIMTNKNLYLFSIANISLTIQSSINTNPYSYASIGKNGIVNFENHTYLNLPKGEFVRSAQKLSNVIFIQKKLESGGIWCGVVRGKDQLQLVWEKYLGMPLDTFLFYRKKLWLSSRDGTLYHSSKVEKNKPISFQSLDYSSKDTITSLTHVPGKKEKILAMTNTGEAAIFDFYSANTYNWKLYIKPTLLPEAPFVYVYKDRYSFSTVKNKLYVWSLPSGKVRYRPFLSHYDFSTKPFLVKDSIFIGTDGDGYYRIKLVTKASSPYLEKVWRFATKGKPNDAIFHASNIFVTDDRGFIYSLAASSGRRKWEINTRSAIHSPLVFNKDKNLFYTANEDGKVYAINENGKIVWQKTIADSIHLAPQISTDYLYVVSEKGYLYKLDIQDGMPIDKIYYGDDVTFFFYEDERCYIGSSKGLFYTITF